MIQTVKDKGKVLAFIIPHDHEQTETRFITPGTYPQQMGLMSLKAGHVIQAHAHNIVKREIDTTQEVLFIRRGKVRVDFYSDTKVFLESRMLFSGDVILLASGGHGFEMMEDTDIIEVKQGPYLGENDKERF